MGYSSFQASLSRMKDCEAELTSCQEALQNKNFELKKLKAEIGATTVTVLGFL